MRGLLALACVSGMVACAPATSYVPSAVLVPMFTQQGQVQASAQGGPQGLQVNAALAVGGQLMLRMTGQTQTRDDGHYRLFSVGAGGFIATRPRRPGLFQGYRLSMSADFGVADIVGSEPSVVPAVRINYNGFLYRTALQFDVGADFKYVQGALVARMVYFKLRENESGTTYPNDTADWWMIEPAAVLRLGPEELRLEAQAGWSKPFARSGFAGDYRRWFGSLGLVAAFE